MQAAVDIQKMHHFSNLENINFYEQVGPQGLEKLAVERGMHTCNDIKVVMPIIENANTLLEVGAGYGRVVEYLLSHDIKAQIDAIEPAHSMFDHLQSLYGEKINLKNTLVQVMDTMQSKYDCILWMWSGLADFSWEEQGDVFKKLSKLLKANGTIIIDTFPEKKSPVNTTINGECIYRLSVSASATIDTYSCSESDIFRLASAASLRLIKKIPYKTAIAASRNLYLLTKS